MNAARWTPQSTAKSSHLRRQELNGVGLGSASCSKPFPNTVRVEIHEYDGAVFTDIFHATRGERVADKAPPTSSTRRARHQTAQQPLEIRDSGFIPGEDVTVAFMLSHAEGSPTA